MKQVYSIRQYQLTKSSIKLIIEVSNTTKCFICEIKTKTLDKKHHRLLQPKWFTKFKHCTENQKRNSVLIYKYYSWMRLPWDFNTTTHCSIRVVLSVWCPEMPSRQVTRLRETASELHRPSSNYTCPALNFQLAHSLCSWSTLLTAENEEYGVIIS